MATRQGICGAKTRKGGRCKQKPMKNGRCYLHGGKSTGPPKGSQNALKTGEYETILVETLDQDERELFDRVSTDKKNLLEEELQLITFREHRILDLISRYREQLGELLLVSEENTDGTGPEGPVNITKQKREAVEISIIRCEEALTRVQAQKRRLIDLAHKMQLEDDGDSPLDRLAESIAGLRKERSG